MDGEGGPRMDEPPSPSCPAHLSARASIGRIGVTGRAKRLASLPRHHHAYCFVLVCSEVFCMCSSSAGRGTRLAGVFVRSSSTGWAGTACSFFVQVL